MNQCRKILAFVLFVLLAAASLPAQSPKVERTAPAPASASSEIKAALQEKGYRVTLADGWSAELWLVKNLKLTAQEAPGALYPELSNSEFIGVLNLPKGMNDFRGQAIPSGTYSLRYQLLPQDANHMGISPNPDFLLAIPISSDTNPESVYPLRKLVTLSSKATGAHPAVIAMENAGEPGTAVFNEQKMLVMTVTVPSSSAQPEGLGIVLKGQASQ